MTTIDAKSLAKYPCWRCRVRLRMLNFPPPPIAYYNRVNLDLLPSQPWLAPLFGYTRLYRGQRVATDIVKWARLADRELSNEEMSHIGSLTSRGLRMECYGLQFGLFVGLVGFVATRKTWKYPMIKTLPDPNSTRLMGRESTRGLAARTFHTTARAFACCGSGLVLGYLLGVYLAKKFHVNCIRADTELRSVYLRSHETLRNLRMPMDRAVYKQQIGSGARAVRIDGVPTRTMVYQHVGEYDPKLGAFFDFKSYTTTQSGTKQEIAQLDDPSSKIPKSIDEHLRTLASCLMSWLP